jgi:isopenicillin N synthase-like dioxygenase
VRTAEGEWIRPPAVPGTFVVNTGAMLARYSNDRFKATPHRVINRNDQSRYAIPFFLGPNHDALVEPVSSCVGPDNPPRYEPTTYGAFSSRLLTLNFAHRRSEASTGRDTSSCASRRKPGPTYPSLEILKDGPQLSPGSGRFEGSI